MNNLLNYVLKISSQISIRENYTARGILPAQESIIWPKIPSGQVVLLFLFIIVIFFQTQLMMESIISLHEKVCNWHCSFGIFTCQTSLFDVNYSTWILKEKFPLRFLWILKRLMWWDELSSLISWITVTCYKILITISEES